MKIFFQKQSVKRRVVRRIVSKAGIQILWLP
jgi:hypothetical protein